LVPAYDGGDDLVGVCGSGEGLGVMVGLVEIAVDGGLEVDDGSEGAAPRIASRRRRSKALRAMVTPGRMPQIRMPQTHRESHSGFNRQI
jgi:hypothetical protein